MQEQSAMEVFIIINQYARRRDASIQFCCMVIALDNSFLTTLAFQRAINKYS